MKMPRLPSYTKIHRLIHNNVFLVVGALMVGLFSLFFILDKMDVTEPQKAPEPSPTQTVEPEPSKTSEKPSEKPTAPSESPSEPPSSSVPPRPSCELREAVEALPLAPEDETPYDRSVFGYGGSTRDIVLDQEETALGWYSPWDDKHWKDPSEVHIDHTVALSEAWDSGATEWNEERLRAYGNDTANPESLRAITASVNIEKSDSDPAQWLPDQNRKLYVEEWVKVKTVWDLSVDSAEKTALLSLADTYCGS